jgi:hypothetical protein
LAGAPFSFLGIPAAVIASLIQRGALAIARQRSGVPPRYFIALLALHYISAVVILSLSSGQFADWEDIARIPQSYRLLLFVGIAWYVIGQVFVWKTLVLARPRR